MALEKRLRLKRNLDGSITANDQWTQDYIDSLPVDFVKEFEPCFEIRNPLVHRKFMKMLALAYDNLPASSGFKSKEAFRKETLIKAGYYNPRFIEIDGQHYMVKHAKSLSFSTMDEREFREVMKRVHEVLLLEYDEILPVDFLEDFF